MTTKPPTTLGASGGALPARASLNSALAQMGGGFASRAPAGALTLSRPLPQLVAPGENAHTMRLDTPKRLLECRECKSTFKFMRKRCPACDAIHTIGYLYEHDEETNASTEAEEVPVVDATPAPVPADPTERPRISLGSEQLDRVLGETIVEGKSEEEDGSTYGAIPGFVYLLAGEPGIGKSTVLGQSSIAVAPIGIVLYATAEEMLTQVQKRLVRIAAKLEPEQSKNLVVVETKSVLEVERIALEMKPTLVIIDSVSTIIDPTLGSAKGGVAQVKASCTVAQRIAHSTGAVVFLIAHVTKDGDIAGPRALEHEVDCVLVFKQENKSSLRTIQASKNRGGSTTTIGIFEMTGFGLRDVADPSARMLAERRKGAPGCVIASLIPSSGSRAVLVEVQAIVSPLGDPRKPRKRRDDNGEDVYEEDNYPVYTGRGRVSVRGSDASRVGTLIAVIERDYPKLWLSTRDVFINITSGLTVNEPAIDAAIVLAIVSAAEERPVADDVVVFGEIDLVGTMRSSPMTLVRVKEAERSEDFRRVIMPTQCVVDLKPVMGEIPEDLEPVPAATIVDLCHHALVAPKRPRRVPVAQRAKKSAAFTKAAAKLAAHKKTKAAKPATATRKKTPSPKKKRSRR